MLFINFECQYKNTKSNTSNSNHPIVDFSILHSHRAILLSIFMLIMAGFLMYTVIHIIPILSKGPTPLGFGNNAIETSYIMLPIPMASVVGATAIGFFVSKIGDPKSIIIGAIVITCSFIVITNFYLNEQYVLVSIFVISIGYVLMHIAAINLIMLCVPIKMIGASVSVAIFLKYIGAAAGPAICGIYMGTHLSPVFTISNNNTNGMLQLFPSSKSYQFVFLYCTTVAIIIIFIAVIANKFSPKCQNYSCEERGEIGNIANKLINEIQIWEGIEIRPHTFGRISI
ncbi:Major Facilitator Superfamily protein [Candidatus Nitrosocosmicus oleophilus]|uniref:Major Facilitator Superfamily protein n=1 Tax=Candidatus Nitrosocosmicus oleophilus TaxID=1353260 RepID=A0A654LU03_9ARCH|nr:Major Facilitator Superfamily protein [Candidatus Nitrosocosmicus oleophilus]